MATRKTRSKRKRPPKRPSKKEVQLRNVAQHGMWTVCRGKLVPSRGRPDKVGSLFKVIAEKIPFVCLRELKADMDANGLDTNGIYLAHDSMGAVRYAGRGNIFNRLAARKKAQDLELVYFSFYVIPNNKHEREIETVIIRAASHLLEFNDRKKRPTILPGSVSDYEPGTLFYERQKRKGRRRSGG